MARDQINDEIDEDIVRFRPKQSTFRPLHEDTLDDRLEEVSEDDSSSYDDDSEADELDSLIPTSSEDDDDDNLSLVDEDEDDDIGFSKKRKTSGKRSLNRSKQSKKKKPNTKLVVNKSSTEKGKGIDSDQQRRQKRREKEETLETDMLISETSLISEASGDDVFAYGPCEYPRPLILRLLQIAGRSSRIVKAQASDHIDDTLLQSLLRESRHSTRHHEDEIEGRQRLAAVVAALGLSQDIVKPNDNSLETSTAISSSPLSSFSPAAGKALASVRESLIEAISSAVPPYNAEHSGPPLAAQSAAEDARVYAERSKKRRKLDKMRGELAKVIRSSERLQAVNGDRSKVSEEDLYWIWVAEKRFPASSFAKSLEEWTREANKLLADDDAGDCGRGDDEVLQDMPPSILLSSGSKPQTISKSVKSTVKSTRAPPEISTASLDVRCTLGAFMRIASQAKSHACAVSDASSDDIVSNAAKLAVIRIAVTPIERVFGLQLREDLSLLSCSSLLTSSSYSTLLADSEVSKFKKALSIRPLTPFGFWLSKKSEAITPSTFKNLSLPERSSLWDEYRTETDETIKDAYRKESCAQFLSAADHVDGCSPIETKVNEAINERIELMSDPLRAMKMLPAFQAAQFRLKLEIPIPPRVASEAYTAHMMSSSLTSTTSSSTPGGLKPLPIMQKGPLAKGLGALLQKKSLQVMAPAINPTPKEPFPGVSRALNLVRSLRAALPGFLTRKKIGGYRVGCSEKAIVADVCSDVATLIWTPSPRSGDPERIFNKVGIDAHIEAAKEAQKRSIEKGKGTSILTNRSDERNASVPALPLRASSWNAVQALSSPDAIDTCQGTLSVSWSYRITAIDKADLEEPTIVEGMSSLNSEETQRQLREWATQFLTTIKGSKRKNSKSSLHKASMLSARSSASDTSFMVSISDGPVLSSSTSVLSSLKTPAVKNTKSGGVLSSLKVDLEQSKSTSPKKSPSLNKATSFTQQHKSPTPAQSQQSIEFVPPPTSNKTKIALSRLLSDIMDDD